MPSSFRPHFFESKMQELNPTCVDCSRVFSFFGGSALGFFFSFFDAGETGLGLAQGDRLVTIRIVKPNDLCRGMATAFLGVLEFGAGEPAAAIFIPTVEFFEQTDHLSLDGGLRSDGAGTTGTGAEC